MADSNQSDFSDRLVSAYNKFMYFGALSIMISVFPMQKNQAAFSGLNIVDYERSFEFMLLITCFALALNYALRLKDEQLVLSNLKLKFEKIQNDTSDIIGNIQDKLPIFQVELQRRKQNLDRLCNIDPMSEMISKITEASIANFDKAQKDIEFGTSQKFNPHAWRIDFDALANEIAGQIVEIANLESNEKERFQKKLNEIYSLDTYLKQLEIFNQPKFSILEKRNMPRWAALRYKLVDVLYPLIMFLSVCFAYIWPNETAFIHGIVAWLDGISESASIYFNQIQWVGIDPMVKP